MSCNPGCTSKRTDIKRTIRKSRKSWKISKQLYNIKRQPSFSQNARIVNYTSHSIFLQRLSRNQNSSFKKLKKTRRKQRINSDNLKVKEIQTQLNSIKEILPEQNYSIDLKRLQQSFTGLMRIKESERKKPLHSSVKYKTLSIAYKMDLDSICMEGYPSLRTSISKKNSHERDTQLTSLSKIPYSLSQKVLKLIKNHNKQKKPKITKIDLGNTHKPSQKKYRIKLT